MTPPTSADCTNRDGRRRYERRRAQRPTRQRPRRDHRVPVGGIDGGASYLLFSPSARTARAAGFATESEHRATCAPRRMHPEAVGTPQQLDHICFRQQPLRIEQPVHARCPCCRFEALQITRSTRGLVHVIDALEAIRATRASTLIAEARAPRAGQVSLRVDCPHAARARPEPRFSCTSQGECYLMKRISEYFGSGQRLSGTCRSSLSATRAPPSSRHDGALDVLGRLEHLDVGWFVFASQLARSARRTCRAARGPPCGSRRRRPSRRRARARRGSGSRRAAGASWPS